MENTKEKGFRLSLTNYNRTHTFQSPYEDEPIEDIIHAFYSLMIGATWHPDTVIDAMRNFVEEHTPTNYDDPEDPEEDD